MFFLKKLFYSCIGKISVNFDKICNKKKVRKIDKFITINTKIQFFRFLKLFSNLRGIQRELLVKFFVKKS